jgi:hypothetical protein
MLYSKQCRLQAVLVRVVAVLVRAAVNTGRDVRTPNFWRFWLAHHDGAVALLHDDERHKKLLLGNAVKEVITCDNSANSRWLEHLNSANTEQKNLTNYLLNT